MDPEGYIPVSLIASFPRLQSLTTDHNVVIDAIRSSDKLEMNELFQVSVSFYNLKKKNYQFMMISLNFVFFSQLSFHDWQLKIWCLKREKSINIVKFGAQLLTCFDLQ